MRDSEIRDLLESQLLPNNLSCKLCHNTTLFGIELVYHEFVDSLTYRIIRLCFKEAPRLCYICVVVEGSVLDEVRSASNV